MNVDFRSNCLILAAHLENMVAPSNYSHTNDDGSCGSPCCAYGHAKLRGLVPDYTAFHEADRYFGAGSYHAIFRGGAFVTELGVSGRSGREVTPTMAAKRLREYADEHYPALKLEKASGAEICKLIIAKPYRESVSA